MKQHGSHPTHDSKGKRPPKDSSESFSKLDGGDEFGVVHFVFVVINKFPNVICFHCCKFHHDLICF